jgi:Na+/proline symporter
MLDLYKPFFAGEDNDRHDLIISRIITIVWAVILTLVAFLFIQVQYSVVEIALGIASITYGGLLGTFLLGRFFKSIKQPAAIAGFMSGILAMILIILIPKLLGIPAIVHWTWFVAIGSVICIITGRMWQWIKD